jgi:hypothetical protein
MAVEDLESAAGLAKKPLQILLLNGVVDAGQDLELSQ